MTAQLLKASGHLPMIALEDISNLALNVPDRFCGCPDSADEEIAGSDPEKISNFLNLSVDYSIDLIVMHQRMLASTGAGSWPHGCLEAWPENHAALYYVNVASFPKQYTRKVTDGELDDLASAKVWGTIEQIKERYAGESMLEVALTLMEISYQRVNMAMVRTTSNKGDNIHVLSKYIAGSTIGYAYFPDGTCGDHVTCNIDSSYSPGLLACALLLTHEIGHNNKLPHTFSGQSRHHGVMSYSPKGFVGYSTGEEPYDRSKDPSFPQLIRQYGPGTITGPDPDPDPVDWPLVTGKMYVDGRAIRGVQTVGKYSYLVAPIGNKYHLVPKVL